MRPFPCLHAGRRSYSAGRGVSGVAGGADGGMGARGADAITADVYAMWQEQGMRMDQIMAARGIQSKKSLLDAILKTVSYSIVHQHMMLTWW